MKIAPRVLRRVAAFVVAIPAGVALLAQVVIWLTPGCRSNPYALGECIVAGANLAAPLLLAVLGGIYVATGLLVFITVPLLVASWILEARRRRKGELC